ncbi:MAG: hypothetical protein RMJ28_00950 [Nitrososphaerota archaeon]|nr:hypothetical protein [Candidatus Calditenuaceae archaeon]MDW8072800.1 hypothetical protein [Nitrososphaerota archaeon]
MSIGIEELRKHAQLIAQLSYPSRCPRYAASVLRSVEELGVDAILLKDVENLNLIGKGFRNIVLVGLREGRRVAVKVRRDDYPEKSTWREARMLELANRVQVGPLLFGHRDPVLVMELIEGPDLTRWLLHKWPSTSEAKTMLLDVARQCFRLDRSGIDHGELSDASKHVIAAECGPVVIDFGSASHSIRPKNLTSFINYLYSRPLDLVRERLSLGEVNRRSLRAYKETYSHESLETLLAEIQLL